MQKSEKLFDKNHFLILKAIAIIAIMVGHVGNFSGRTWFTPLGGFGVAIFLFCSGYGLSISAKNGGVDRYWTKKFINVYMPFFIIEIVAAVILQWNFKRIVLDVTLLNLSHPYGWYMQYIFICYLLFYVVFKFVKRQEVFVIIFFMLGVFSFFAFPNLQAEQALSFPLGIAAANYDKIKQKKNNKLLILGIFLVFIGVSFLVIKQLPTIRNSNHYIITLVNLIIKLFSAMGVVLLSYLFGSLLNFLTPFGKMSYELYLLHGYLIFCIANNLFGNFILNTLAFLLITCLLSWAFYIINVQIKKRFRRSLKN